MTRIADLLAAGRTVSYEVFPPKTEEQEQRLEKVLLELAPTAPSFVSVTYGALGSTREQTKGLVEHVHRDLRLTVMPHLTCVAQRRVEIEALTRAYRQAGIENLLALAGDPPLDGRVDPGEFRYAVELIELAREVADFSIGVAAFPEKHPRSADLDSDRRHLAEKLRQADFAITQFFFDADDYFRLVDDLHGLGVDKPVIPGLLLFNNVAGVRRMAAMNGAAIPAAMEARLDQVDGDPGAIRALAVEVSAELGRRLLDGGAPGLHLCTLNYARATRELRAVLRI